MMEGAETVLLTMGSYSETASLAIEKMRAEGVKVGQLRIRLWRPFPFEELRAELREREEADSAGQGDVARRAGRPGVRRGPRGDARLPR